MSDKPYCPIMACHIDKVIEMGEGCPCGWPKQACIRYCPEARTDGPPEPNCIDDGETWRSV